MHMYKMYFFSMNLIFDLKEAVPLSLFILGILLQLLAFSSFAFNFFWCLQVYRNAVVGHYSRIGDVFLDLEVVNGT